MGFDNSRPIDEKPADNYGKFAIWGSGDTAEKIVELIMRCQKGDLVACADIDHQKHGRLFHGIEIVSPIELQGMLLGGEIECETIVFAVRNMYLEECSSYFRFCKGLKGFIISDSVYFNQRFDNPDNTLIEIELEKPRLSYLQTDIVKHCNLRCKGCLHCSNLISKPLFGDYNSITRDWYRIRELFWGVYKFRILGGEPLLNKDIIQYIEKAREIFRDAEIYIVTNGLLILDNPHTRFLLDAMIDNDICFDITLYDPMRGENRYRMEDLLSQYGVKYFINDTKKEFYKMLRIKPDQDMVEAHSRCLSRYCHNIEAGKIYSCPRPSHIQTLNERFNTDYPTDSGCYDIYNENDGWALKRKISAPHKFCTYCAPPEKFTWERISPESTLLDDWIII